MAYTEMNCDQCGRIYQRPNGHINRSRSIGAAMYCSMTCSGLARRRHKSEEQKKGEKRLYDMEYRAINLALIKERKKAYYQATRDPKKEKAVRKARMHLHIQYCKQPWYKEWKKEYDQKYRAKKFYGEFWESSVLLTRLENELEKQMSWYERQMAKGTLNKANQRRITYEREHILS